MNFKLGEILNDVKCPKCKNQILKITGLYHKSDKNLLFECQNCFYEKRDNEKFEEIQEELNKENNTTKRKKNRSE